MNLRTLMLVLAAAALGVLVLAVGVWLGATLARPDVGALGTAWGGMGPGMMPGAWQDMPCAEGYPDPGMLGGGWGNLPCGGGTVPPEGGDTLTLGEAEAAIERYLDRTPYSGLHIKELMEFERNFYAIVAEEDTGIGAMELLIDKSSGSVGPEPGPNMMWNARYGMHGGGRMGMGRMWGLASGEMALSPQEAELAAQLWLDANLPGRTAGEADAFYGYYTLHFLKDGQIDGMLSVHGSSGDVWYHSWHGGFVAMTGEHD